MNGQPLLTKILGAQAGYCLGLSRQGRSDWVLPSQYAPDPVGVPSALIWDLWDEYARAFSSGLPAERLGELRSTLSLATESVEAAFGEINLQMGLTPPISGSFRNPLALSFSGIARSSIWGMALEPHQAATYAYWDCEVDQTTDVAVTAGALAYAFHESCATAWLRQLLAGLERAPDAAQATRLIISELSKGVDPKAISQSLQTWRIAADPYGYVRNLGHLVLAVLAGAGSFQKTVSHAVAGGGDACHIGLVAGALAAQWYGIPEEWASPLGASWTSSRPGGRIQTREEFVGLWPAVELEQPIEQLPEVVIEDAVPTTTEQPDSTTAALVDEPAAPDPEPAAEPEPVIETPRVFVAPELPTLTSTIATYRNDHVIVRVEYLDSPVAFTDRVQQFSISFEAVNEPIEISPTWDVPQGWNVAHRITPHRVSPGAPSTFPVVLQAGEVGGEVGLTVAGLRIPLVTLEPQHWYVCGPFANYDGAGFEKAYRCEDVFRTSEMFAGRGDLGVKWRLKSLAGVTYDLEPYFMSGPGVIYLYAKLEFAEPGDYRLVASGSPGVLAKINGQTVIRYHQTHQPVPRPMAPYVASFSVGHQPVEVLVKVTRNQERHAPLVLYFLDQSGRVVFPVRALPMPD